MKTRPILLLVFLFFFLNSYSQAYDSLVVENAQWKVMWDDEDTPWSEDEMSGWLLRGDTVIDGLQYKKLYSRVFEDPYSDVITSQVLFGCLREDVENKKVYAIDFQPGFPGCDYVDTEYLLFDFSYEQGDTANLCILDDVGPCELEYISYDYLFGKERNEFYFTCGCVGFIEGIGHEQGLLESPIINVSSMDTWYLYDYCRGTDEECGVFYVNLEENVINNSFSIYPNPAKDRVRIHLEEMPDIKISNKIIINDIYGRCVRDIVYSGKDIIVDVSELQDGIYLVNLFEGKKILTSKKLFISR